MRPWCVELLDSRSSDTHYGCNNNDNKSGQQAATALTVRVPPTEVGGGDRGARNFGTSSCSNRATDKHAHSGLTVDPGKDAHSG